jgi:hypothetical protein
MSKLMSVLGIVLLAIGAALALVGLLNPAQMQVYGLTLDTAAILLTGGILSIGLGGVIAALQNGVPVAAAATVADDMVEEEAPAVAPPVFKVETTKIEVPAAVEEPTVTTNEEAQPRVRFNPFGRKPAAAVAATAGVAAATVAATTETVAAPAKSAVDDTIAALEQAKADIANAIGGVATINEDKVDEVIDEVVEDDVVEEDEDVADGELYVLEEREIRGRPARILSDNTVEAETDEGWMRFENLEHLNEYMDAMEADA